ncbi:MAG: glycosyltransferase family 2 protein [Planctomycetota bacterium]|jgi:glycosyltransferase involved in cell wall biosynthesis
MEKKPYISVVIPVKNGGEKFEQCLQGLTTSNYKDYELIVVNDASKDNSVETANKYGAMVLHTADFPFKHKPDFPFQDSMGPAGARNIGVKHANGEIIFFIDGDVIPKSDNLDRLRKIFTENTDIDAVFGTYDDSPGCTNLIAQYRNLLHSFIHQISLNEAETFWTGCGAIRKEVFTKMQGFDLNAFRLPSVEDIDLGYRLKDAGHRIYLDKGLQVKHLKEWTFKSMLKTDVFQRAIPWSRTMFRRKSLPNDLNIQTSHRISGGMVLIGFALVSLLIGYYIFKAGHYIFFGGISFNDISIVVTVLSAILVLSANVIFLNYKFYLFLFQNKGLWFLARSIPLHFFYYLYSTVTFALFFLDYHFPLLRKVRKRLGYITHA